MANLIRYRLFLFFTLFLTAELCSGQKFEIRANAYSGLFFFRGTGAVYTAKTSFSDMGYFNAYPYGKKSAFSYAVEPQIQKVTKSGFLYGIGIGYENLKSKVNVDTSYTDFGIKAVNGEVILVNKFVTLYPYVGRRFNFKQVTIDALAGVDFANSIKVVEKVQNVLVKNYNHIKKAYPQNRRPRIQLNINYQQVGFSIGYSIGTENLYHSSWSYLNKKVKANYLRVGVNYKLPYF